MCVLLIFVVFYVLWGEAERRGRGLLPMRPTYGL